MHECTAGADIGNMRTIEDAHLHFKKSLVVLYLNMIIDIFCIMTEHPVELLKEL